jgi:hypothetical protein
MKAAIIATFKVCEPYWTFLEPDCGRFKKNSKNYLALVPATPLANRLNNIGTGDALERLYGWG